MSSKPTVTLTVAGDSDSIVKSFRRTAEQATKMADDVEHASKAMQSAQDRSARSAQELAADFAKAGAEAKQKLAPGFNDAEQAVQKLSGQLDKAGVDVRAVASDFEMAARRAHDAESGFDRIGERFDYLDTKAMGARDGVTGVQDSMESLSYLAKGDFTNAMLFAGSGLSDLGSAGYNAVVPMLKDLVARFGAARVAAVGIAGAIGLVAAAVLLITTRVKAVEFDLEHADEDLKRFVDTGTRTVLVKQLFDSFAGSTSNLSDELYRINERHRSWQGTVKSFANDWGNYTGGLSAVESKWKDLDKALSDYLLSTNDVAGAQEIATAVLGDYRLAIDAMARGALPNYENALHRVIEREADASGTTAELTAKWREATASLDAFVSTQRAALDPVFALTEAQRALKEAQDAYNDAVSEFGPRSKEAVAAQDALAAAELDVLDATTKVTAVDLSWYQDLYRQGQISADALAAIERNATNAKAALGKLNGTSVGIYFNVYSNNQALLERALSGYYADYGAHIAGLPAFHDGGYVPGARGQEVAAVLQAGEYVVPLDQVDRMGWAGGAAAGPGTSTGATTLVLQPSGRRFEDALLRAFAEAIRGQGLRLVER